MTKLEKFNNTVFTLGILVFSLGTVCLSFPYIISGILLIYFSEVPINAYKDYEHKKDMKEIQESIEKLRKMTDEEKGKYKEEHLVKYDPDEFRQKEQREKAWAKKHPVLYVLKETYDTLACYLWYRLDDYPNTIKRFFITKYQRAQRGWADQDAWSLDCYLAKIIKEGCVYLKKNKHGVPMSAFKKNIKGDKTGNPTDGEFEEATKNWETILDTIIKTFETAEHIQNDYWHYQESANYDVKQANRFRRMNKKLLKKDPELWGKGTLHVMTKRECEEYEKGWNLLQKHFFGLDD